MQRNPYLSITHLLDPTAHLIYVYHPHRNPCQLLVLFGRDSLELNFLHRATVASASICEKYGDD